MKTRRFKKQALCTCMTAMLILALSLPALAGFVFIEAESGKTDNFPIISNADAFSGKAIEAQTDADTIEYTFTVENAGKYIIWARVMGIDSTMNSFLYSLDGEMNGADYWIFDLPEAVDLSNTDDAYYESKFSTDELYEKWYWMPINYRDVSDDPAVWHNTKIFDMAAGEHTLVVKARELSSKIDKFIITDDLSYYPNAIAGDPEIPYLEALAAEKAAAEAAEAEAAAAAQAAQQEEAAAAAATEPPPPAAAAPQTSDGIVFPVLIFIASLVLSAGLSFFRKGKKT
ncbi:MAG: hypothetical protein FWG34_00175 [Oscillospiraceae bacterium]|nr:hypothetical protein [Oscillospiraceae bacterium]